MQYPRTGHSRYVINNQATLPFERSSKMVQSAQTVLFHEDVKENIEVIASMIVGADLCPHCARIVKVINYRGIKDCVSLIFL